MLDVSLPRLSMCLLLVAAVFAADTDLDSAASNYAPASNYEQSKETNAAENSYKSSQQQYRSVGLYQTQAPQLYSNNYQQQQQSQQEYDQPADSGYSPPVTQSSYGASQASANGYGQQTGGYDQQQAPVLTAQPVYSTGGGYGGEASAAAGGYGDPAQGGAGYGAAAGDSGYGANNAGGSGYGAATAGGYGASPDAGYGASQGGAASYGNKMPKKTVILAIPVKLALQLPEHGKGQGQAYGGQSGATPSYGGQQGQGYGVQQAFGGYGNAQSGGYGGQAQLQAGSYGGPQTQAGGYGRVQAQAGSYSEGAAPAQGQSYGGNQAQGQAYGGNGGQGQGYGAQSQAVHGQGYGAGHSGDAKGSANNGGYSSHGPASQEVTPYEKSGALSNGQAKQVYPQEKPRYGGNNGEYLLDNDQSTKSYTDEGASYASGNAGSDLYSNSGSPSFGSYEGLGDDLQSFDVDDSAMRQLKAQLTKTKGPMSAALKPSKDYEGEIMTEEYEGSPYAGDKGGENYGNLFGSVQYPLDSSAGSGFNYGAGAAGQQAYGALGGNSGLDLSSLYGSIMRPPYEQSISARPLYNLGHYAMSGGPRPYGASASMLYGKPNIQMQFPVRYLPAQSPPKQQAGYKPSTSATASAINKIRPSSLFASLYSSGSSPAQVYFRSLRKGTSSILGSSSTPKIRFALPGKSGSSTSLSSPFKYSSYLDSFISHLYKRL